MNKKVIYHFSVVGFSYLSFWVALKPNHLSPRTRLFLGCPRIAVDEFLRVSHEGRQSPGPDPTIARSPLEDGQSMVQYQGHKIV